jgi:hypothetical protein
MISTNLLKLPHAKPVPLGAVFGVGTSSRVGEPNVKRDVFFILPNVNKHGVLLVESAIGGL